MIDHNYISARLDRNYMVPMSKVTEHENNEELVRVSVRDGFNENIIVIEKDGYRTKRMYKKYFEWLIYTNYIKVLGI